MTSVEDNTTPLMKLKRFCFLGTLEPVYTHLRTPIDVQKYFSIIEELVKPLSDKEMIPFLREVLHECTLVRRDEALFVYATYLAIDIDIEWKTAVRLAFAVLIKTEDDLFTFCKYSSLIGKQLKHKSFSRTVRKAITAWYELQTPEALRTMWMAHRGLCGFTHRVLLKLCHISDQTLGSAEVANPFFKTCAELIKENEPAETAAASAKPQNKKKPNKSENLVAGVSTPTVVVKEEKDGQLEVVKTPPTHAELITGISKLRTTKKNHDALKIIRKYKLPYHQVPGNLLSYAPIMTQLLPTMSHFQIFKCWRRMARNRHLENQKIFKLCKSRLENKDLAKKSGVHPIHFLMNMRKIGVLKDVKKLPSKKVESFKMEYLNKLYLETFNWNTATGGDLRMHITLNLQSNYKKKFLKNHRKLNYYEACLALSFGYWKREKIVDVFHWYEEKMKLKKIVFEKDCTAELGLNTYDSIVNAKNYQRLVTPIMNALNSEQVYDVFLCIVPTAGRGNPQQNSSFLARFLTRYHEKKNPKAKLLAWANKGRAKYKFIILNLLKFKRSMTYSTTRNENILEICGLDEHTPSLIHNFATHRFE